MERNKFINQKAEDVVRAKAGSLLEQRLSALTERVVEESDDLTLAIENQEEDRVSIVKATDLALSIGRQAHKNLLNAEARMLRTFRLFRFSVYVALVGVAACLIKLSILILK